MVSSMMNNIPKVFECAQEDKLILPIFAEAQ